MIAVPFHSIPSFASNMPLHHNALLLAECIGSLILQLGVKNISSADGWDVEAFHFVSVLGVPARVAADESFVCLEEGVLAGSSTYRTTISIQMRYRDLERSH